MNHFFKLCIMGFAGLWLNACAATSNKPPQNTNSTIAAQVKSMSSAQKHQYCSKLQANHTRYRKKIIPIMWAAFKKQKNSKISYSLLSKKWLILIHHPDATKLGKEFTFYKDKMLLNLHYGKISKCAWMQQKAA